MPKIPQSGEVAIGLLRRWCEYGARASQHTRIMNNKPKKVFAVVGLVFSIVLFGGSFNNLSNNQHQTNEIQRENNKSNSAWLAFTGALIATNCGMYLGKE